MHGNYKARENEVSGNLVHDITPPGSCNKIHGIYVSDYRSKILNNIVYDTAGWGIHTWHHADELTIANNLVYNNAQGGIIVGGGSVVADGFVVSNNIAVNNRVGIYEFGKVGTSRYVNNLVYSNKSDMILKVSRAKGTLRKDPQLAKSADEYRLREGSPAVNAGTTLGAPNVDYDGKNRTASIDIGPFER